MFIVTMHNSQWYSVNTSSFTFEHEPTVHAIQDIRKFTREYLCIVGDLFVEREYTDSNGDKRVALLLHYVGGDVEIGNESYPLDSHTSNPFNFEWR